MSEPDGQHAHRERLRQRGVLVVGVGALGTPAALHLAAAGVGRLGLVDGDTVELSNLQRQILYRTPDVGQAKVAVAAQRITTCYPQVSVQSFREPLSVHNLAEIFGAFDFVIDATDGIASKYLINDGAVLCGVPFSHAGVLGFVGQTLTVLPRRSACLRCLFPSPPLEGEIPTCQEAGVIGALAGGIGLVQAMEALKYLLGTGHLLTDRLLTGDAARARWRTVRLSRNLSCPLCGEQPAIRRLESVTSQSCK